MKNRVTHLSRLFKAGSHGRMDVTFLFIVILLSVFGTVTVFTAGYAYAEARYSDPFYFIKRQVIWVLVGFLILLIGSRLSPDTVKKFAPLAYVATLGLLILTLAIGFVGNGAQRWISIGPLTIQPSEIAKLTMTMMLARYFSDKESRAIFTKKRAESFIYGTLIPFAIILIPVFLVMLQHHLSCIVILGLIGVTLIILSGANLKYLGFFSALGGSAVAYIAFFTDYTKDRITVWLDPEKYKLTGGWQVLQGLMAIGSGGFFGKGLGKGELKHCYVSEPANDMIFAILCEELGFIGAFCAMSLFAALIIRGFKIAFKTSDTFARLLTLGITSKIAIQTLLNVAVVTGAVPNTGISLPFFSYGGSSLIMLFFEMGLILSVSRKVKIIK